MHRFWNRWSGVVLRHPLLIIAAAAAVSIALGLVAAFSPYDLSFTGLLPQDDPEVIRYQDSVRTFGADSTLLLLLEGEEASLDAVAVRLESELPAATGIRNVLRPVDPQWLLDRAPFLWPDELFQSALEDAAAAAPRAATMTAITAGDALIKKMLRPKPDAMLISLEMPGDPLDMAMGGKDYHRIEQYVRSMLKDYGGKVTGDFTGIVAVGAQDQGRVFGRVKLLTPLTFIAVLLLLRLVERHPARILAAGAALGFSVFIAFGMTGLMLGKLSITSTFFGMLLLGLGIDFAIHLMVVLRDAHSHGLSPEDCVRQSLERAAHAIALGAMTTALAFGIIALVPEPGARDMGSTALWGILSAVVLMLSFLPAAWLMIERRHAHADRPSRFDLPGLQGMVGFALKRPRIVLGFGAVIVLFGAAGLPRYKLESDLAKIISRKVPALEVEKRLRELFNVSPTVYIAPVESLVQARAWSAELRKLDDIAQVSSAADLIRPDADERHRAMRRILKSNSESEGGNAVSERLRRAAAAGPITIGNIHPTLASGVVGKKGELAIRIVADEGVLDSAVLEDQIRRLREIAPTTTGMPALAKMVIRGRYDYVPIMMLSIFCAVVVVLTVSFRSLRDIVLALLPVVIATLGTFGIFCWFDLQFSILTSIVVPVILGLGVDDGIHVVERLRRAPVWDDGSIHDAVEGVGRAIFLTTATTWISFLGLLFSDHRGMEHIGIFMLIGMPLCFIASVTMIPAAAKLWNGAKPPAR